jgi:hypothetical protein
MSLNLRLRINKNDHQKSFDNLFFKNNKPCPFKTNGLMWSEIPGENLLLVQLFLCHKYLSAGDWGTEKNLLLLKPQILTGISCLLCFLNILLSHKNPCISPR